MNYLMFQAYAFQRKEITEENESGEREREM